MVVPRPTRPEVSRDGRGFLLRTPFGKLQVLKVHLAEFIPTQEGLGD